MTSTNSAPAKRYKVIVVGGGVAGLTAAHELVERNFDVEVYERRDSFGGKAASKRVALPGGGEPREKGYPAEHGFRFFPGWYRHLPDTLRRIPVRRPAERDRQPKRCVLDHLVATESNRLFRYGRAPLPILLYSPKDVDQAITLFQFFRGLAAMGLPARDAVAFLMRLAAFIRTPPDQREKDYDPISWWDFVEANRRSESLRTLIVATTRTLLAAKAEEASAYTIALLAVRTLFDAPLGSDSVLDGPTSEVWLEPWILYLRGRGVQFFAGHELDSIRFGGEGPSIGCVTFTLTRDALARRKLRAVVHSERPAAAAEALREYFEAGWEDDPAATTPRIWAERSSPAAPADLDALRRALAAFERDAAEPVPGADTNGEAKGAIDALRALIDVLSRPSSPNPKLAADGLDRLAADLSAPPDSPRASIAERMARVHAGLRSLASTALDEFSREDVLQRKADFYVFALPAEQMAYYVDRSPNLRLYAPELEGIVRLAGAVDWMAGIQFYLRYPLNVASGHMVFADSEWALTAIEQTQFWRDVVVPPGVQSILSVDVSAWTRPGRFNSKEAFRCTRAEIAAEVLAQLKTSLNRDGEPEVLRDDMLLTGGLDGSYHLDDDIVERHDRKKQAAYSRGIDEALQRAAAATLSAEPLLEQAAENLDAPFVFGDRLQLNVEPLLVNRPGLLSLRPPARTAIDNMFLAADYVKTSTNLACMEGANEAARIAVNAILETAGSKFDPCRLWSLQDGEALARIAALLGLVERMPGASVSVEAASGTLNALAGLAARTAENLKQIWRRP